MFGIHRNFPAGGGGGDIPTDLSGDGTILFWNMGVGSSGAYTPDVDDADYADASVTVNSNGLSWTRDGSGYLFGTSSGSLILNSPAKSGICREYRAFWAETNASPSQYHQCGIIFNWQDSSNYWWVRYMRNTTGTWNCEIIQKSGGSDTSRAIASFTATIDPPGFFMMLVQDWGDTVHATIVAVDGEPPSAAAEIESRSMSYFASSRALKSEAKFGLFNNFTEFGGISNLHVRDIISPA